MVLNQWFQININLLKNREDNELTEMVVVDTRYLEVWVMFPLVMFASLFGSLCILNRNVMNLSSRIVLISLEYVLPK